MAKIPVIITNFNLYTWPKAMVKKLMRMPGVGPILIVDNDSTYGPTLEWYEQLKLEANEVAVIRTGGNFGHLVAWQAQIPQQLFDMGYPDYIVTDPDLDLSALPDDTLLRMRELWYDLPEKSYMYEQRKATRLTGLGFRSRTKSALAFGRTMFLPMPCSSSRPNYATRTNRTSTTCNLRPLTRPLPSTITNAISKWSSEGQGWSHLTSAGIFPTT
jgi:hypothetical protein